MARIPSLPFRVVVHKKPVGAAPPVPENHNYPDLPGAWAYRDIALRRPNTRKVEIVMVLDESTPDHHASAVQPNTNGGRNGRH
jgi:hypothetical protein